LRYYTISIFTARYDTENEITFFDGTTIPKGTICVTPLGKVLGDPEIWDNPDEFDPDRFYKPESKLPLVFAPFGFGGRICPGRQTAYASATMFLGSIFKKFNLIVTDPEPERLYGLVCKPATEFEG
jgi:cytochrome P450